MHDINNFVNYKLLKEKLAVQTANSFAAIVGKNTIIIKCLDQHGGPREVRPTNVMHVPDLMSRLLSLGVFLANKLEVCSEQHSIRLLEQNGRTFSQFKLCFADNTIYGVNSLQGGGVAQTLSTYKVDYDIMHRRLGHPSRDVVIHKL
jgi:hypothetical protein